MEDQAPTTIDKYICKLAECVLFNSPKSSLTIAEICDGIESNYQLQFDVLEVENAIKRKARNRVIKQDKTYRLSEKTRDSLKRQTDMLTVLKKHIANFRKYSDVVFDENEFLDLMLKYLYFCFNSNINNLMSLLENKNNTILDSSFFASNHEVKLINDFIAWDNDEKNKFLYSVISFSYEYCMLATKKDSLLSQKIFKGKKFILDTNIIFRMAGINKDERQYVTNSFVKKCKEVGIQLCYTSETLSELHRVIHGQIKYIEYITQNQEPVSNSLIRQLNNNEEINDFYEIYYKWSSEPQNKYNDLLSFQQYLFRKIQEVTSDLTYLEIPNYLVGKDTESFTKKRESLRQFKLQKRPQKVVSTESLQTDINNLLYTLSIRRKSSGQNLWQTNEFIVSADQLLTNWAREVFPGIPIVVIPSVWLSIILRFSGRTSDDYKSYCLFLSLRQHRTEDDDITINPIWLLSVLAQKTLDKAIKEKIIFEIINNKEQYEFETKDDYYKSSEKAFDKILSELKAENVNNIEALKAEMNHQIQQIKNENLEEKLKEKQSQEEILIKIANKRASDKILFFSKIKPLIYVLWSLAVLLWISVALIFLYQINPIYNFILSILPSSLDTISLQWDFIKWILIILTGAFPAILGGILKYLGSDERREKLYKKYYNEGKRAVNDTYTNIKKMYI